MRAFVLFALLLLGVLPAYAQDEGPPSIAPKGPSAPTPRMADGKPDMQGYWTARSARVPTNANNLEEHPPSFLRRGGKTMIVDPPDGRIPYQPWALEERDRRRLPQHSYDDPELHCFVSGVPRQMYVSGNGASYQFLQPNGYLVILFEYIHAERTIPLDGRKHASAAFKLWEGDSVGRWEGDTLVVETTNNNGKTWFELSGNFMSAAGVVVERFTMKDADTIEYRATITDRNVFTRPWTIGYLFERFQEPGYELLEQACHEDNRDMAHIKAVQTRRK